MQFEDRVLETSTTTGTGNITLDGAVTGYWTFATAFAVGDDFYYCIEGQTPGEWEVGIGHLSNSTTLVRLEVRDSSNSNALVSFSAGMKNVFCTVASQYIRRSNIGTVMARSQWRMTLP